MLHKEFWGLLFLGFVFWVVIAGTPQKRIENACAPVGWSGSLVVSLSALVVPKQQQTVQSWFDKFEYGCRYVTWRLFYQDDYNQWLATQGQGAAQQAGAQPGAASAVEPAASQAAGAEQSEEGAQ